MDRGRCLIDGEDPAVAGYIPIELVMRFKEAELIAGGISDFIGVGVGGNYFYSLGLYKPAHRYLGFLM